MLTHALRISLLGLMLVTTPALAESPIPIKKLNEMASVLAHSRLCAERELVPMYSTDELNAVISGIAMSDAIDSDRFLEYERLKKAEIENSDRDMTENCRVLHSYVIRWSMEYWALQQKHGL